LGAVASVGFVNQFILKMIIVMKPQI